MVTVCPRLHPSLHGAHVTGPMVIRRIPKSRNYGTNHPAKVNVMHGKSIRLHQDGVASAHLLYRPEVTEELTLAVSWLRSQTAIELSDDEMEALGKALIKGVKKIRKHKKKQADKAERRIFDSLDSVSDYIKNGRRK